MIAAEHTKEGCKPRWRLPWLAFAFLLLSGGLNAASDSIPMHVLSKENYFISLEQKRIDKLDGIEDGQVALDDLESTALANRIYFRMIDSIQQVLNNPVFDESKRTLYREYLFVQLRRVNGRTIYSFKHFNNIFRFVLGELHAIVDRNLYNYLTNNLTASFNTLGLIKNESCADSFLVFAANYRPDLVLLNYDIYAGNNYSLHVLEVTSKIAPVMVKRYFNPKDPIFEALKTSDDTVIKVILQIKDKYTRKSNAFTLIDGIMNGSYSMEEADAIGNNPRKFLQEMIKIRSRPKPLGAYSLEEDLATYSLKFVRVLNDLHMEKDEKRFASIEKFSAEEIYTLMVYSEEEIFTSTFNGLFNRLIVKLGPVSGFEFLKSLNDNRFRTFIKMSAGFGKLTPFLQTMTAVYKQMLMIKFASGLEQYNDLSQAVEVADAFGSITDSLVLKILRGTIRYEYIKLSSGKNVRGMAIYGLLSNLFVERNISNADWFSSISKQYAITSFDRIPNEKLFDRDTIDRWLIYFYDDEDGEASFSSFLKTFTDPNWKIIDSNIYVIIKSKTGKHVEIYANKSKSEYEGQAALEKVFSDNGYEPNVMVHRGHSYYAFKTIEKVRENTQIFVLGSCGGYHSISSIIDRSPEISIISSKQIGTRFVNNPMLKLMAEYIRKGKDVEWQNLWDELGAAVKGNTQAYARYEDYIPPHKNLGAIFIKTYNKMMENE